MSASTLLITSIFLFVSCEAYLIGLSNSTATPPPSTTNPYAYLEALLLKERQMLQDYCIIIEQKLTLKDQALEQRLNKTEETIANLAQSLINETSKRVELQKDYDKLIVDFYDLNVEYTALSTKNKDLQAENAEQEIKIKALENAVNSLNKSVSDIDQINITAIQQQIVNQTAKPTKGKYYQGPIILVKIDNKSF